MPAKAANQWPETPAATVIWLLQMAECPIWLDGGWGVDALLGCQTRPHEDVDVIVAAQHAPDLVARLGGAGFSDVPRDDSRACNFVLGCARRGLIDFHLVQFDAAGNGIYGLPEPEGIYPAAAFAGRGSVLGQPVQCVTAAFQIENRLAGHRLRAKDFADMAALAAATGLDVPASLRRRAREG
ncbi:MAG: hypothetical protein AAFR46_12480 [Pseudomonadota bacterium]